MINDWTVSATFHESVNCVKMNADESFSVHELEIGAVNELVFTEGAIHIPIYVRLHVERSSVISGDIPRAFNFTYESQLRGHAVA
jgi:hypothetical protein